MRSDHKNSGFSLLEVLVAVLILSFITTTIWISFSRSVDLQNDTRTVDERANELFSAINRISRDISMAYISRNRSPDKRTKTVFLGKDLSSEDRLDFAAFSHTRILSSARESDECEISYYTEKVGDKTVLFRREAPQIDNEPETGGTKYPILEDITSLNFRYFDPAQNSWVDVWDSESIYFKDRLPTKVEIKIGYKDYRGNPAVLETMAQISMLEAI